MTTGSHDQADAIPGSVSEQLPEPLPADPFPLILAWFNDAHARRVQPNPNAMTLATIAPDGRPSARIVLCKGLDAAAGYVEFFTNYTGPKAVALDANPRAALVFHWDNLDRQVRIEGLAVRSPAARSDEYFASRPWQSRIGAWASDQSQPVASRRAMADRVAGTMRRFGLDPDNPPASAAAVSIPRPAHWGGYRVHADRVELWLSGEGRVHDRAAWVRTLEPDAASGAFRRGTWSASRLQP